MKRVVGLLVLLVCFGGVLVGGIKVDETGDRASQITDSVDEVKGVIPVDLESGEIDTEKIESLKDYSPLNLTDAEVRIEGINSWLEDNATWLKVVFGMVPSLTWLFAANLWLWLWFLVLLGFNADKTFGWMPFFGEDRLDFVLFHTTPAQLFGLVAFALIVILKWVAILANFLYQFLYFIWNYVIPYGIIAVIVFYILVGIGAIKGISFTNRILGKFAKEMEERRERKAKEKERVQQEALDKFSQEAWGGRFD